MFASWSSSHEPGAVRMKVPFSWLREYCDPGIGAEARTIVCGAPNVAAGQTVAVALPGAVLPGGQELGPALLRGVVSDGMILSETELGLGDDAAGIIVLADGPGPGTPLAD